MGEKKSNSYSGKKNNKKNEHGVSNKEKIVATNVNEEVAAEGRDPATEQQATDSLGTPGTIDSSGASNSNDTSNTSEIKLLADKVTDLNTLRFELDRLPLDFKAKAYFDNDIKPLIDTLYTLGLASLDFSTTAANLANTNFGRSSKIKGSLDLSEDVNEISGDIIKVLRCKVDNMLKLSRYDIK